MLPNTPPRPASAEPAFGEDDFKTFQQRFQSKTGIALNQYKSGQMQRRTATLAAKTGCKSFESYMQLLEQTPEMLTEFLGQMTINVTELLRNPERFAELSNLILPHLPAHRPGTSLSVWSAGCSYGAEAYTLAMLLHENNPALPHRIKGTDLDQSVLARTAHPCFSSMDMLNISPARRAAHFQEAGGGYQPKPHLRAKVRFAPHDLLTGAYPTAEHDLIVCRNVIIYFTDEAKEHVCRGFWQALRPGGVLFLGGMEHMLNSRTIGFETIRPFFYRKPR